MVWKETGPKRAQVLYFSALSREIRWRYVSITEQIMKQHLSNSAPGGPGFLSQFLFMPLETFLAARIVASK